MRTSPVRRWLLLLVLLAVIVGCTSKQQAKIVGRWRAIDIENRGAKLEFFADGKVQIGSSQLLDWTLTGRELRISHPESPKHPLRVNVTCPDEQHLELAACDRETGKPAPPRRFERVATSK